MVCARRHTRRRALLRQAMRRRTRDMRRGERAGKRAPPPPHLHPAPGRRADRAPGVRCLPRRASPGYPRTLPAWRRCRAGKLGARSAKAASSELKFRLKVQSLRTSLNVYRSARSRAPSQCASAIVASRRFARGEVAAAATGTALHCHAGGPHLGSPGGNAVPTGESPAACAGASLRAAREETGLVARSWTAPERHPGDAGILTTQRVHLFLAREPSLTDTQQPRSRRKLTLRPAALPMRRARTLETVRCRRDRGRSDRSPRCTARRPKPGLLSRRRLDRTYG